jgi:phosphoenolpyruvate synthase/pyruvate phosphate dikinase
MRTGASFTWLTNPLDSSSMKVCRDMKYVVFFSEANPDPSSLGGKGSNIVKLFKIGMNVPPGFIVNAESYAKFLGESRHRDELQILLSKNPHPSHVVNLSRTVRNLILDSEFPEEVQGEVEFAFDRIRKESGTDASFAVRSSATIEDMSSFSFAGQGETYLNNCTFKEVLSSVRGCWASLFSLGALSYFAHMQKVGRKHSLSDVRMAVVVQKMIDSQVSGVMFTANVMNNNPNQIMINSTWGLGEAIANNSVIPDMYILQKGRFRILKTVVGEKEKKSIRNPRDLGTIMIDTDPGSRSRCCLDEDQLRRLFDLGLRVERAFGSPQDIEWAMENGTTYIMQSRPITALRSS